MTSTKTDGGIAVNNITTGLLPNYLTVSGKTRQNDLDVAFLISIQPGAATSGPLTTGSMNQRQAFVTFGDASWGSVKVGKDLGIYASGAILNDMTLLGVGAGAATVGNTTLGRIGYGYQYADWKSQVSYTSPNFNGFSLTAGVTQAWNVTGTGAASAYTDAAGAHSAVTAVDAVNTLRGGGEPAFEAQVSYAFSVDAVSGKVWASGITQNVALTSTVERNSSAWDIGANINAAGFGLTGYYGEGKGMGTLIQFAQAYTNENDKRKSDDWYVQGTYAVPGVGTKLGVSYGESTLDGVATNDLFNSKVKEQLTFGAYHPLTKHLNLVAEYTEANSKVDYVSSGTADTSSKAKTYSLGAILFF